MMLLAAVYLLLGTTLVITDAAADSSSTYFDNDTSLTQDDLKDYVDWTSSPSASYFTKHTFLPSSNNNDGSGAALFWVIDNELDEIQFAIVTHDTQWVGLGVSEAGGMIGSDIALFQSSNPDIVTDSYVLEDRSSGPLTDDCQDWTLVNSTVLNENASSNWLIVEVKRQLNTFDTQDIPIVNDSELWSAPTRIIAAWGTTPTVSYHGTNKARASIRLFAQSEGGVNDGIGLHEVLEATADGMFEVMEENYVIPNVETTYHDICRTYEELFPDADPNDTDGVALIGATPFFSDDTEQYLQHFHHFTVHLSSTCDAKWPRTMIYMWAPGNKGLALPSNTGLPLFDKDNTKAIHMEIHFDNPELKKDMVVSGGVRFYYMNEQQENKAGILELGDPILSMKDDPINAGLTKYQFTCPGKCSQTFAAGKKVTVFNEFLHMHQTGLRMTNELIRDDEVVHSSAVDVYDFEQQGGYHVPQDSFEVMPGDSFRTTCYYRDGDKFGVDSDEEMCIAYVMYYPVLELLDYSWLCPAMDWDAELLSSIGCVQEVENSDIDSVEKLERSFGKPASECDADLTPTKSPSTEEPTISKSPTEDISTSPCLFCTGGLVVESSTEVPGADGATCGGLVSYASFYLEGSNLCTELKGAEIVCCPTTADNPCSFCKDGLSLDEDFIIPGDEANGATCGDIYLYANLLEDGLAECTNVQRAEAICCPRVVTNPCSVCTDGLVLDEDFVIPFPQAEGATCGELVEYAQFVEGGSEECSSIQLVEFMCCPSLINAGGGSSTTETPSASSSTESLTLTARPQASGTPSSSPAVNIDDTTTSSPTSGSSRLFKVLPSSMLFILVTLVL